MLGAMTVWEYSQGRSNIAALFVLMFLIVCPLLVLIVEQWIEFMLRCFKAFWAP